MLKGSYIVPFLVIGVYLFTLFNATLTCLSYEVNNEEITTLFCENKDNPELKCNGKCYLMKQLKSAESDEENVPEVIDTRTSFNYFPSYFESLSQPVWDKLSSLKIVRKESELLEGFYGTEEYPPWLSV